MKKLIVLNHKMNMDYDEVYPYIDVLNKVETDCDIVVVPSNIYLTDFVNHCEHGLGAQNVYYKESGNYTGEVSVRQLKSIGVEYSLVGHYERRKCFGEGEAIVNKKLKACLDANIIPILCFGASGEVNDVIDELREILKEIENIDFIIFAYEPLKVDGNKDINDINADIEEIHNYLYDLYEARPTIIYGGGVANKDARMLLNNDLIDGLLIGGVSSKIDSVEKILKLIK